jgi:hypothetical protein
MSTQIQRRRGTTAEHSTFTGVEGELTVDTTKDTAVVHDGTTVGGHPLQKQYPPLGSAAAPTYTFTGDTNTGIYSPGADQVAVATNGTQRLLIKDASQDTLRVSGVNAVVTADAIGSNYPGFRLAVNGSVLAGFDGDGGTSANLFTYAAVPLVFGIDSSERMRITSAGLVGIGTSSPQKLAHISNTYNAPTGGHNAETFLIVSNGLTNSNACGIEIQGGRSGASFIEFGDPDNADVGRIVYSHSANSLATIVNGSVATFIDSSGRVGIGTTSPNVPLDVYRASGVVTVRVQSGASVGDLAHDGTNLYLANGANGPIQFWTNGSERARIDPSGRLLVGTSTARTNLFNSTVAVPLQVEGTGTSSAGISVIANPGATAGNGPAVVLGKSRGSAVGGTTVVASGDELGVLTFQGSDGSEFVEAARISAEVDGTPGANDMPGRLVFFTTADGASSRTERMRITSGGYVLAGKTASDLSVAGFQVAQTGQTDVTVNNSECMNINRNTSDGSLIRFFQDNTFEGSISVSGTTVSYNGAHLSRWSQLPSGAARTEILRGSVLSNLDEMCEWGEEDNEQLNRMKVSDVEGDKNVSGVFQAWDDDDDTYTNDFYCAMTGDFIIRIGAGVTVERGDLLMSAGDGTAKPQDDDIIRSKTIAKVTSTNVSCTYDDGSYCVPCVLMAC